MAGLELQDSAVRALDFWLLISAIPEKQHLPRIGSWGCATLKALTVMMGCWSACLKWPNSVFSRARAPHCEVILIARGGICYKSGLTTECTKNEEKGNFTVSSCRIANSRKKLTERVNIHFGSEKYKQKWTSKIERTCKQKPWSLNCQSQASPRQTSKGPMSL